MNTDINLLLHTDEESSEEKKRIKLFNLIAIASLMAVGLISLGIFILAQIINSPSVKKDQENTLRLTSQFQGRQTKLFVLNNRVENISKILEARRDLPKVASNLLEKVPSDLFIEDFEVNDKSVIIVGYSKSLFAIGEFINNLTDMVRKEEVIRSLILNSLALDLGRNVYQVSLTSGF